MNSVSAPWVRRPGPRLAPIGVELIPIMLGGTKDSWIPSWASQSNSATSSRSRWRVSPGAIMTSANIDACGSTNSRSSRGRSGQLPKPAWPSRRRHGGSRHGDGWPPPARRRLLDLPHPGNRPGQPRCRPARPPRDLLPRPRRHADGAIGAVWLWCVQAIRPPSATTRPVLFVPRGVPRGEDLLPNSGVQAGHDPRLGRVARAVGDGVRRRPGQQVGAQRLDVAR